MSIRVSYEFSGMGDYWGGNGRRWDDNAGCLFAFYGRDTTLADIVDQLVDDYNGGSDCDSFPEEVTDEMLREAIMSDLLNDIGRADVASGALAECAVEFDACNPRDDQLAVGDEVRIDNVKGGHACGTIVKITDNSVFVDVDGKNYRRDAQDVYLLNDDDDCGESPIFVALVEIDVCPDCGCYVEDDDANDDGLCDDCAAGVPPVAIEPEELILEGYTELIEQDDEGNVALRSEDGEVHWFAVRDSYSGWCILCKDGRVLEFCRSEGGV